jgi:hypothetical protein
LFRVQTATPRTFEYAGHTISKGFAVSISADLPIGDDRITQLKFGGAVAGLGDSWTESGWGIWAEYTPYVDEITLRVEGDSHYTDQEDAIYDNTGTGGSSCGLFETVLTGIDLAFNAWTIYDWLKGIYQQPPVAEWQKDGHWSKAIVRQVKEWLLWYQYVNPDKPRLQTATANVWGYFEKGCSYILNITAEAKIYVQGLMILSDGTVIVCSDHIGTYGVSFQVIIEPDLVLISNDLDFTNIGESTTEVFNPGVYRVKLYAEFAGYHASNELSWYTANTSDYNLIFSGPEGNFGYINPPISKQFVANNKFGLSFLSGEGIRYYTETSRNPDKPIKHAQIYVNLDNPNMYLIGFENKQGSEDRDYNDMVISLEIISKPPNTPPIPSGPVYPCVNGTFTYSTSTTDPDGDNICYQFDWGDGSTTTTDWYPPGATASASHSWSSTGAYNIRVRAKDTYGTWSDWSSPLTVTVKVPVTEVRYMRGDQQTVNGLTAYILGLSQSDIAKSTSQGYKGLCGLICYTDVAVRHADGSETPIANGIAAVSRGSDGEGIQSATWNCPYIPLEPTDAIKITVGVVCGPSWHVSTVTFITEPLGATSLAPSTWTVYYYTKRVSTIKPPYVWASGYFYWGTTIYNSRIEGFAYTQ